jgi:hypothetical protein
MANALRRFFSLFEPIQASFLSGGQPTPRRRALHRQRRASPHVMRFRKPQVRRTIPLLIEMPGSSALI